MSETIRLHMNEMPYPPSPGVIEAAQRGLARLHRYADAEDQEELRWLLADYCGVPQQHIVVSPGSDLLLREVILICSQGRRVITSSPSFLPTVRVAEQFAAEWLSIRLSPPSFDLNLDLLMNTLEGPSLVIFDNPNNPTGRMLLDPPTVEALLQTEQVLLVIDEAYYEFSGVTFADSVPDHPQLTVIRTMDKAFSLAGARIAYGVAGRACLEALSSFYAFLPQASLGAAITALKQPDYMRENVRRVIEERERIWQALAALGVRVFPSDTNFLLVQAEVPEMVTRLRDDGVLVSDVSDQLPPGFFRVSMGTREENDAFVSALARRMHNGRQMR